MAAQPTQKIEDWDTSAEDALRVSLISSDVKSGNEVKKWNLDEKINMSKTSYSVIDENPYDVSPAPEYEEEVPIIETIIPEIDQRSPSKELNDTQAFDRNKKLVGIYTPEDQYADALILKLAQSHETIQFIRYDETNAHHFSDTAFHAAAFVIHMTDEDESTLLDQLIEEHGDKSTLFLCDTTINERSVTKIEDFLVAQLVA